jgi:hypothetical protein
MFKHDILVFCAGGSPTKARKNYNEHRLAKKGIRAPEKDCIPIITTNSPAMERLHQLGALALYRAGKSFYPNKLGVIPRLPGMFKRAGFQIVSQRRIIVDISAGTEGHIVAYEDYKILLRLLHPFFVKWGKAKAKEVDELYEQFLQEIQQGIPSEEGYLDPFVGSWDFYSIFGQKPA